MERVQLKTCSDLIMGYTKISCRSELSCESKQALCRIIAACQTRMTPKEMSSTQSRENDASGQGDGNGDDNDATEDRVDEKVCEEFTELVLGGIPRELRSRP